MNIGEAARTTGVTSKMIRHYESIGLIKPGERTESGYRIYRECDLDTLRFIRRARSLGFSLEKIQSLLSLWQDTNRASADVKAIADEHVAILDKRIRELTEMRDTLSNLSRTCMGNHKPDCPIIKDLSSDG